jgi:hypothetical protein
MQRIAITTLAALALTTMTLSTAANGAATKVYRTVDENGNVIFTDMPPGEQGTPRGSNTTEVELDAVNGYEPTGRRTDASGRELWIVDDLDAETEEADGPVIYSTLTVDSPAPEEALRANDGTVHITGALLPALAPEHRVRLVLDGAPHSLAPQAQFTLTNMDRGAHTVSLEVVDASGTTLISSTTTTFYVLRAHR